MNRELFQIGMNKITATKSFKEDILSNISTRPTRSNKKNLIPIGLLLIAVLTIVILMPRIYPSLDSPTDEFKIIKTDKDSIQHSSYSLDVYYQGYVYSSSSWLLNSPNSLVNIKPVPEKLLGETNLDLKGITYTGTPPDFSSTYDVGAKIYKIEGIKTERAILFQDKNNSYYVFHRIYKAYSETINLTVNDVITMISDKPQITEIELRSEENGTWMRTTTSEKLITQTMEEINPLELQSYTAFDPKDPSVRVSANLITVDGAALNIQFYPNENYAYIFGGYISISDELCAVLEAFHNEGDEYDKITDFLPTQNNDISYLYIEDYREGIKLACENPLWSGENLYSLLNYYRIIQLTDKINVVPIMSFAIGYTKEDAATIVIYKKEEAPQDTAVLYIGINDILYSTVNTSLFYEELHDYLYRATELGLESE